MAVTKLKNTQLPDTISSKTVDNTNTISTTLSNLSISGGTNGQVLSTNGSGTLSWKADGVSDGDKGDVTVSASGATWTIDNGVVTYAKIQNVSATSRLLGRATAGAGSAEEITIGTGLSLSGTTISVTGAYTNIVTKSADETVSGTTTLQDDDELFFTADANSTYAINLELVMEKGSTVANRIKGGWSYPTGSTGQYSASGSGSAYALISTESGLLPDYATSSTGPIFTTILCVIKTSTTSGTIKFRWSLASATTPSITVKAGSRLLIRKL